MISGITMGPNPQGDWSAEAIGLGADTAYPYQGEGAIGSILSVMAQAVTTNDSRTAALNAVRYALSTNQGLIDIVAYSGGAAAFTAAYGQLSSAEQARIGQVLYISPGAAPTLATGQGTTSVLLGRGIADVGATVGSSIPVGVPITSSNCAHTDLTCLFKAATSTLNSIGSDGSCNSPEVFTRTAPTGTPGMGFPSPIAGGGGTPPGPAPFYWQPLYYGEQGAYYGPGQWITWSPKLGGVPNKVL
jgi:hypothetical protein